MKRCPVCNSRKWHGYRGYWKCGNCGKIWEERASAQGANNDKGIIESSKPSLTINNSSLDCQLSSKDTSLINSPMFQEIHDLHNNAYKFRITKDNPNLDLVRQKGFKGRYFIVPHQLNIKKSKNWLVIYNDSRNRIPLKNLDKTDSTMLEGLTNIALEIADKYSFEIDPAPILFSKNRHEVKTPFLSANNFYEEEAKAVYPVPSPIELHGENSVKNAINLSAALVELNQNILLEIQNKQMHQAVLVDMRDALKAIQQNGNHVSFFSKIRDAFKKIGKLGGDKNV